MLTSQVYSSGTISDMNTTQGMLESNSLSAPTKF